MKLVIKIGGQGLEEPGQRRDLAQQVARLRKERHSIVLVHGGGRVLTQTLERLNIPTRFLQGLRVTDAATRDVALMVLAGAVNKQLVAALETEGVGALGLCGGDAALIRAQKAKLPEDGGGSHNLGFVGQPQKVNTRILEIALRENLVPVVASMAPDARGDYLNVNADDFAAALAIALKADRLLYLTESGGVWDAQRHVLPLIRTDEIRGLIQKRIVRDGMIPKLKSCARTLRHSVREIQILPSEAPNVLISAVENGRGAGTRIVPRVRVRGAGQRHVGQRR